MEKTVRETIKETIFYHIKKNSGFVFGQCLSAVGWVGGTLPELTEKDGLVELPMSDVSKRQFGAPDQVYLSEHHETLPLMR